MRYAVILAIFLLASLSADAYYHLPHVSPWKPCFKKLFWCLKKCFFLSKWCLKKCLWKWKWCKSGHYGHYNYGSMYGDDSSSMYSDDSSSMYGMGYHTDYHYPKKYPKPY
uniref:KRMPlx3 n=1 Tax=Pinctada maxima TaxID=104660 RepID=M1QL08_PINMA|nr:KRMPlx3 [Pinctada maxima]